MSTELAIRGASLPDATEINTIAMLANHLANSRRFKDAQSGYEAFAKLMFGRDLGLSATAAMTGVHIVEGKPEIGANIHAQMVKTYLGPEGERYDYKVLDLTGESCKLEFLRRRDGEWEQLGVYEYAMADAATAGLASKANWKKHPRNMLFARAMSDGVAFYCPEVTNGVRTYHEGEIDSTARDTVSVLTGTVETVPLGAATATPDEQVVDAEEVIDGEPVDDQPAADLVNAASVDELQAAAKGLTVSQIRLALGSVGIPAPDPFDAATAFDRVPAAKAAELTGALAGITRTGQEAAVA